MEKGRNPQQAAMIEISDTSGAAITDILDILLIL